jgi:hypothetical protein
LRARIPGSTACDSKNTEVDRQRVVPGGLGHLLDAFKRRATGVVDEYLDRTETAFDGGDQRRDIGALRYVAFDDDGSPAQRSNRLGGALRFGLAARVVDGNVAARGGERERDPLADAAARSGHERHSAVQRRLRHAPVRASRAARSC